ncbi:MAG: bifunctional proline dehydrogenase/L-glutamate gamma-semialdehyde dehydrogenase [Actinomycetota bacterium]
MAPTVDDRSQRASPTAARPAGGAGRPDTETDTRTDAETETDADADELVDRVIDDVARWLRTADEIATRSERATATRLAGVVADPVGLAFTMAFVDRVVRPDDDRVAARQLASVVDQHRLPGFLGPVDRLLLRAGARLAPMLPRVVMPLARRRMRAIVGHLVVDADDRRMASHFADRREEGFDLNVNLLGEAVLGETEAVRRFERSLSLLGQPSVDYVSVKVSSIVSQLNHWDHDGSKDRILERLRVLMRRAATTSPPTFVNLDMEEYHDLELTIDVFTGLLGEPEFHPFDAGIVLQAYLPDSFDALRALVDWATARRERLVEGRPGGEVKIRLVKGANLAMERVDAAIHGWEQAPYRSKAETDANYKRCLDHLLRPERMRGVRLGLASHNLFDCAFAMRLAERRGVSDRLTLEMLEGMSQSAARVGRDTSGSMLLYTPVVDAADFDVAISYLFRRLEENTSDENFISHLGDLRPGSEAFESEAERFRRSVVDRRCVGTDPQRVQTRRFPAEPEVAVASDSGVVPEAGDFVNEPDTDPALPANRAWAAEHLARRPGGPSTPITESVDEIDALVGRARAARIEWSSRPIDDRRRLIARVGDVLSSRRGDLLSAMAHEANKTVAQADPEISEAIDFARYYAAHAIDAPDFEPFGVVAVVPPWNFPVAIPTGGVLAALAAGNAVMFKPAPETPRCAEVVAECMRDAGLPPDLVSFVRTRDDEVGRHLVSHDGVDAIVLTGAHETATMFQRWRPGRPVLAETSGKNALVITPSADIDLAVADLVASAFGHGGQKCSAASLAIVVDPLAGSDRFRRQLVDAVSALRPGPAADLSTDLAPLIAEPDGKLRRGLTELDTGEEWLVEPSRATDGLWTPGVRIGVREGSWFHRTECFGPVLGIMRADDLDHAIRLQNGTEFGLTGGLHTLDRAEIDHWLARVDVGNAYVNRGTTGAIVQRQPFGGWKRSSVGPGAHAGGPNYVAQLGRWIDDAGPRDEDWLARALASDRDAWHTEFGRDHDPTGLFCESNVLRYRPLPSIAVRVDRDVPDVVRRRVAAAAERCGVPVAWSTADDETQAEFADRLGSLDVERVRILGTVGSDLRQASIDHDVHLADGDVTADGRRELLHFLREQAVSRTLHRYGNVVG